MKLALHRSITFWSGLLAMGFICWAWWDSLEYRTSFLNERAPMDNCAGGLAIYRGYKGDPTEFTRIEARVFDLAGFNDLLPPPHFLSGEEIPQNEFPPPLLESENPTTVRALYIMILQGMPGSWNLFIPHWLLLVSFAALWLALLLLRAKRRKQKP